MDADDLEPRKKIVERKNLEVMSIEALHDYISELEAEIVRIRGEIKGKENAKLSADAFFKT